MTARITLLWLLSSLCIFHYLASFAASAGAQVEPLYIKGSRFFYQNGTQFQVRGITYDHSDDADPLSDDAACERDVKYLLDLNLNVVQVDYVQPSTQHSKCMQAFQDAGIYVVASFYTALNYLAEYDPAYDTALYNHYTAGVDFLAQWNNSLGFAFGFDSFMIDEDWTTFYISFVKRITKDLKDYIKEKNYRDIPVGFRFGAFDPERDDARDNRRLDYLSCGDDATHSDFLALELQDCPHESDIDHIAELYSDAAMPIWVERLGCGNNTEKSDPLNFGDVGHLYSPDVAKTLVGGIVYSFKTDDAKKIVNENGTNLTELAAFSSLSSVMATITPPTANAAQYTPASTTTSCPASSAAWSVPVNTLPPTPKDPKLCQCMMQTITCLGKRINLETYLSRDLNDLFDPLCSTERSKCPGIRVSPYDGIYGAFSICDSTERYSWAASWLVKKEGRECDFDGNATSQTPTQNLSTECQLLLDQVGEDGSRPTDQAALASPSTTSGPAPQSGSSGLAVGAKVGIALGVAVVFAVFAIAGFLLLRHRRRKRNVGNGETDPFAPAELGMQDRFEAPAYPSHAPAEKYRLAQEVDGNHPLVEIGSPDTPAEMDAGQTWVDENRQANGQEQGDVKKDEDRSTEKGDNRRPGEAF